LRDCKTIPEVIVKKGGMSKGNGVNNILPPMWGRTEVGGATPPNPQ